MAWYAGDSGIFRNIDLLDVYHNAEPFEVREQLIPVSECEGRPTHDRYFTFTYVPRIDLDNQVVQ
jgi:hypothetical protein